VAQQSTQKRTMMVMASMAMVTWYNKLGMKKKKSDLRKDHKTHILLPILIARAVNGLFIVPYKKLRNPKPKVQCGRGWD
jgi:hypothetical protein